MLINTKINTKVNPTNQPTCQHRQLLPAGTRPQRTGGPLNAELRDDGARQSQTDRVMRSISLVGVRRRRRQRSTVMGLVAARPRT
ncbi:hypothetical protein QMZ92_35690 [Streptomyces sp. HNM0645]|uniref:hypothetical protein n=1 Tax=Streptomyces sp. HNM0645 TaxID=2782343 RepID=UPI0024B7280A|nr:hypothetical protein [Streptomyces sp. HNM0645]MDI9889499.1 hypothetical protein [Streptomyces sp. HNM0645]